MKTAIKEQRVQQIAQHPFDNAIFGHNSVRQDKAEIEVMRGKLIKSHNFIIENIKKPQTIDDRIVLLVALVGNLRTQLETYGANFN